MRKLLTKKGANLNRPYERCLMYGASVLTDAQLLAVILKCGTKEESAEDLAQRILKLIPAGTGLQGLSALTLVQLTSLPGIGEVKAISILCACELAKRMNVAQREETFSVHTPEEAALYYRERFAGETQEYLSLLALDSKNRVIAERTLCKGTSVSAPVSVRDLYTAALGVGAASVVLVHNHPSGDPAPSQADIRITADVREAGALLGLPLLDHLIIGRDSYFSFREAGEF